MKKDVFCARNSKPQGDIFHAYFLLSAVSTRLSALSRKKTKPDKKYLSS